MSLETELDASNRKMAVSKAFRMMKILGFDAETVKPVLQALVKKYNNDWSLIEESNYHELVYAIENLFVPDITKGREKMKISLIKKSAQDFIPNFNYIRDNVSYKSASLPDKENCVSSSKPCACARGELAYTHQGLLSEKFVRESISSKNTDVYCNGVCPVAKVTKNNKSGKCEGHIVRIFIKECWTNCGCSMQCGNRVVQRGISHKLQVFHTGESKGWGVRTLEKLPAGTFICEYSGEVLTNNELDERNKEMIANKSSKGEHTYPVLLDADWYTEAFVNDDDALCLDATYSGNIARFMNHRCSDGNMIEIPVQVETEDRRYYHLAFFTIREVDAMEELTWDYGIEFENREHPIKAFQCRCGSENCRYK